MQLQNHPIAIFLLMTVLAGVMVAIPGTSAAVPIKQEVTEGGRRQKRIRDKRKKQEQDETEAAKQTVKAANTDQSSASRSVENTTEAAPTEPPPGSRFDLSQWKLTLPMDASRTGEGHAIEISASQLAAGFKDSHFHSDADGAMVFWSPVSGATTEGTEFPRSELREMLQPGDPSVNWTSTGTHVLAVRCRVSQVPSSRKVIIGQIHSYSGKARPLVKLQFHKGRIEALVKSSPTKGGDIKLVWPEVGLNSDIAYQIKLRDDVLSLTVNGTTQTENIAENDADWSNQTFYFKVGAYPQDNQGPTSEGARVSFAELKVSHSEGQ